MRKQHISPAFLLVFSTVVSLTLVSGSTSLWLSSQPQLSEYQVRTLENFTATWQTGIGAIFGLLGGKAAELLDTEEDEDDEESL
jgi:hypothetical protein